MTKATAISEVLFAQESKCRGSGTFNSNNKIVKERIWIAVKLTIRNCVVEVDESNARSRTYSRNSRLHVQNVQEVKT